MEVSALYNFTKPGGGLGRTDATQAQDAPAAQVVFTMAATTGTTAPVSRVFFATVPCPFVKMLCLRRMLRR